MAYLHGHGQCGALVQRAAQDLVENIQKSNLALKASNRPPTILSIS